MTDDLYERYKATLRAGHVALLRGSLQEAAEEYRTAVAIAPSRALPHTSLGGVFMRLGHVQDALTEYSEAAGLAPNDEGALLGLAEALSLAGQRVDAAAALDRVAEVQEASGRLPEAADTLRRGLEFADSPERLQRHRTLLRQIRVSEGDEAAEQLLARALRLREEPPGPALGHPRRLVSEAVAAEISRLAAVPEPARAKAVPVREEPPADVAAEVVAESSLVEPASTAAEGLALQPATGAVEDVVAAWSVEDESVVAEAVVEPEYVEPRSLAELPEIARGEADEITESAVEDGLALDAATLEEALALRTRALAADPTLGRFLHAQACELLEAEIETMPEPAEAASEPGLEPPEAECEPIAEPVAGPVVAAMPMAMNPEPNTMHGAAPESAAELIPGPEPMPEPIAEAESGPAATSSNGLHAPESDGFALPEEVEPPVVAVMEQAPEAPSRGGGAEVQRQPTGDELLSAAEAAEGSGDLKALRSLLVWTARAYAREGRFEAALDAAHRLLQRYPADVDAHLVLVELYVAREWDTLAIDKLALLDRLAQLGEDEPTHERLRAVATRAFPADPRLASILGA
jgi:tetratricopeptide (TPR) repeat protein